MTYYCGIGPGLGLQARAPHIECNGCGAHIYIDGIPPRWFLDKRPKPGWSLVRTEHDDGSVTRDDRCPKCRVTPKQNRARAKHNEVTSAMVDSSVERESAVARSDTANDGLGHSDHDGKVRLDADR